MQHLERNSKIEGVEQVMAEEEFARGYI